MSSVHRPSKIIRFSISLLYLVSTFAATEAADLAISSITAIDAKNGVRKNQTILIKDAKIITVGKDNEIVIPYGTKTLNGRNLFAIPGLWDAHVHFSYDKEIAPAMLPLFLANGITYVRDTGGPINKVRYWKAVAKSDPTENPQVFMAGPLLDGIPTVYTGETMTFPLLAETVATPYEGMQTVTKLAQQGVEFVKAYEMLDSDTFASILDQATALNLPVAGHIPLEMDAIEVSSFGLDSIEHLRNLEISCSTERNAILKERRALLASGNKKPGGSLRKQAHDAHRLLAIDTLDWEQCKEVLDYHIANKTYHNPTTALLESTYDPFLIHRDWVATFDDLPKNIARQWKKSVFQAVEDALPKDEKTKRQYTDYMAWARRVIDYLGGKGMILAGTDTPIYFLTPGASLHKELEALVRAGMSPMEALAAATIVPAQYFGLEKDRGLLEVDMLADIVILKKDPLEDIRNSRSIDAVIRLGTLHTKNTLRENLVR